MPCCSHLDQRCELVMREPAPKEAWMGMARASECNAVRNQQRKKKLYAYGAARLNPVRLADLTLAKNASYGAVPLLWACVSE